MVNLERVLLRTRMVMWSLLLLGPRDTDEMYHFLAQHQTRQHQRQEQRRRDLEAASNDGVGQVDGGGVGPGESDEAQGGVRGAEGNGVSSVQITGGGGPRKMLRLLPALQPPPMMHESTLFTPMEAARLEDELPPSFQANAWSRMFCMREDGASVQRLYSAVQRKGACIMVVKESGGGVFGAFTSEAWRNEVRSCLCVCVCVRARVQCLLARWGLIV